MGRNYNCPKCGEVEVIIKMGGLICSKCRMVLVLGNTEEYLDYLRREDA